MKNINKQLLSLTSNRKKQILSTDEWYFDNIVIITTIFENCILGNVSLFFSDTIVHWIPKLTKKINFWSYPFRFRFQTYVYTNFGSVRDQVPIFSKDFGIKTDYFRYGSNPRLWCCFSFVFIILFTATILRLINL